MSNWRTASLALAEGELGSGFDPSAWQWYLRRDEGTTSEMITQVVAAQLYNMDVRDLLPSVKMPTLVVH
jgi:hypothetical protein